MIDLFKEMYDRGQLGHQDFNEAISPFNFEITVARSLREKKLNMSDTLEPHAMTMADKIGSDNSGDTPEQKENKQQKTKEEQEATYKTIEDLPTDVKVLAKDAQYIWMNTFNSIYKESKNDLRARKIAWSNVKKKYYKGSNGTWKKRK
jgi:cation transport regulator ChaB